MRDGDIYIDGAVVKSVALGKTKDGKPQIAIMFDTTDETYRQVTVYRFFTDAAMPYTEQDLRTLGWDPVVNGWRIDDLIDLQSIRGAVVDLVCAMETYEDKPRLKVKFINAPGGGGGMKDRMEPDEAKAFTTQLRARLGVTGGAARRPTPAPVAASVDDEIPF